MRGLLALAVLLLTCAALPAQAGLTVDISSALIRVTTGFNGSSLTVFGTQEQEGTIVIVVEGPSKPMTVRKKSSVFGFWTVTDSRRFANMPTYYDMAASAPLTDVAAPEILRMHRIGLTNMLAAPADDDGTAAFTAALVRLQEEHHVYGHEAKPLTYITPQLFKVAFDIPAVVTAGPYKVSAFLFKDGKLLEQSSVPFEVIHDGVSAELRRFATNNGLLYGLAGVAMAILAGWLATVLLKRE